MGLGHICNVPSQEDLDSYLMGAVGSCGLTQMAVDLTNSGQVLKLAGGWGGGESEINKIKRTASSFLGVLVLLHFLF